jgi:ribosome-associated translation inhibitor RaiA
MLIQLVTDNHITGREKLVQHVDDTVKAALDRFAAQITRVEVHLNDENSHKKGMNDKRCALEARLAGLQPIGVNHTGDTLDDALHGALDKLVKVLDKTTDKLSHHKGRTSFGGDQTI